jgi:hypothetical protein
MILWRLFRTVISLPKVRAAILCGQFKQDLSKQTSMAAAYKEEYYGSAIVTGGCKYSSGLDMNIPLGLDILFPGNGNSLVVVARGRMCIPWDPKNALGIDSAYPGYMGMVERDPSLLIRGFTVVDPNILHSAMLAMVQIKK